MFASVGEPLYSRPSPSRTILQAPFGPATAVIERCCVPAASSTLKSKLCPARASLPVVRYLQTFSWRRDRRVDEVHLHLARRVGADRDDGGGGAVGQVGRPERVRVGSGEDLLTSVVGVGVSAIATLPAATWIGPEHWSTSTLHR